MAVITIARSKRRRFEREEEEEERDRKQQKVDPAPANKKKQTAGTDGKYQIGLEVIISHFSKILPAQISTEVLRKFGAHLIENAEAIIATAAKNPVTVQVFGAALEVHANTVKQKTTAEPKPKDIINISSDTDKESKNLHSKSIRKKTLVQTLTSVSTEQIKAVPPGFASVPKDLIHDINASYVDDPAVREYIDDVYKFYKLAEKESRPHSSMYSKINFDVYSRAVLADWLIEVHRRFELMPETLYLTFHIMDWYLSLKKVLWRDMLLAGVSSMIIACKYVETRAPNNHNREYIMSTLREDYRRAEILQMEKEILSRIGWNLTVPTQYVFLVRFVKATLSHDNEMEPMVYFFAELGLMRYSMIKYFPSLIAASAVYAARCTLKKSPLWSKTLEYHAGYSEQELMDCAQELLSLHAIAEDNKLKAVYKKYSSPQLGAVALQPPAVDYFEQLKTTSIYDFG